MSVDGNSEDKIEINEECRNILEQKQRSGTEKKRVNFFMNIRGINKVKCRGCVNAAQQT